MKTSIAFPSNYLKAEDLNGKEVTVTIDNVELVELGQGRDKESKLLITFVGKTKGLLVNKTNARTIEKLYGDETDEWIGKRIIIGPKEVEFGAEMVWAIRVSLKAPGKPAAAPAKSAPKPEPGPAAEQEGRVPYEDESVPF